MKLDKKMSIVIADLEFLIGSECYNPHSYDGWTGLHGCGFRYPISFPLSEDNYRKVSGHLNMDFFIEKKDITPNAVKHMKYKLGANELFIGMGLINVLEYLEDRYDLDFNELEKNRKKK